MFSTGRMSILFTIRVNEDYLLHVYIIELHRHPYLGIGGFRPIIKKLK